MSPVSSRIIPPGRCGQIQPRLNRIERELSSERFNRFRTVTVEIWFCRRRGITHLGQPRIPASLEWAGRIADDGVERAGAASAKLLGSAGSLFGARGAR